jgi:hypothetical protein
MNLGGFSYRDNKFNIDDEEDILEREKPREPRELSGKQPDRMYSAMSHF